MIKKVGLALAVAALATAAGCSSGSGVLGVSAGHGSPKAAVEGFLEGLDSSTANSSWCAYVDPSDQADCRQAISSGDRFVLSHSLAFGNQVIQGDEALVVLIGNACLKIDAESTSTSECASNSDQNAGLPTGAQSFSEAYSNAQSANTFATAACIEVDGLWYVNSQVGSGSSSSTSPTTTPSTTATTTPTSSPATSVPATTTPDTTPATTTPDTTPATTAPGPTTTTTS